MIFCLVIAVAYASIWTLFLFETPPKKKKIKSADIEQGEDIEQDAKAPPKKQAA